jgi:CheY-like chemotaxis protein
MHMLRRLGCHVECADDGVQAIERLKREPFDLVFMDCQMPNLDGWDATRSIRSEGSAVLNRDIPVIAMTANSFTEDRERALAAGMNDFLAKPVTIASLSAVIDRWALRPAGREALSA